MKFIPFRVLAIQRAVVLRWCSCAKGSGFAGSLSSGAQAIGFGHQCLGDGDCLLGSRHEFLNVVLRLG
jgi:hypothetical protein